MPVLFTDHYLVFTTPKKVFRKNFIYAAILPIITLSVATCTHYNNPKLTKSMYLGTFLGSLVGVAFWLVLLLVIPEDLVALRIIWFSLYFAAIIAHGVYTKIKEKKTGNKDANIHLYRNWGG